MSFIPKNPLSMPEIKEAPSTPPGTRGLFAKEDGWYEVDGDGVTKKLANSSELPTKKSLGLDKVDNTSDAEKSVYWADYATEAYWAQSAASDGDGRLIHETYAKRDELKTVESIAKGANQAVSFSDYTEMINHLESLNGDEYNIGQNIMIVKLDVPDLWISDNEQPHEMCIHRTEEEFVEALKGGHIKVGCYHVSQLETQKVDLTEYATKEEVIDHTTSYAEVKQVDNLKPRWECYEEGVDPFYFYEGDKIVDFSATVWCAESADDMPSWRTFTYKDVVDGSIGFELYLGRDYIGDWMQVTVETLPHTLSFTKEEKETMGYPEIWFEVRPAVINNGKFAVFNNDGSQGNYLHVVMDNVYYQKRIPLKEKVDTIESIAKGANQAVSFDNYAEMIEALNSDGEPKYNIGQNIYIKTVDVPDLWISGTFPQAHEYYEYTTDEAFVERLQGDVGVQIGVYRVSQLETQKVDLTNYAKKDQLPTKQSLGLDKVDNTPDAKKDVLHATNASRDEKGRDIHENYSKRIFGLDCETVIEKLNNAPQDYFSFGHFIITLDKSVPVLFVRYHFTDYVKYEFTSVDDFVNQLKSGTPVRIGYYAVTPIEVDLSNSATKEEVNTVKGDLSVVESIAKGANQAVSFDNYKAMITELNALPKDAFNIGQNIMIVTLEVPDLWVSGISEEKFESPLYSDSYISNTLKTEGSIQIGHFILSQLETQKVDLTKYATKEEAKQYTDTISEVDMVKATEMWGSYFSVGDKIVDFRQTVLCAENEGDEPVERVFTYADVVSGDIEMYLNMGRDDIENIPGDYTWDDVQSLPYEIIATTWIWDEAECKIINTGKFTTFEPIDSLVLYYQHKIPLKDYTLQTFDKINTENLELKEKVDTVESIAKGANQAVSFSDYAEMINHLEKLNGDEYNIGQNIMIVKLDVPDLWISDNEQPHESCIHRTEEEFVEALKADGHIKVGGYSVSQLETQKVDLTDYATKEEVGNIETALDNIIAEQEAIIEIQESLYIPNAEGVEF